jgi:hypothetical protein
MKPPWSRPPFVCIVLGMVLCGAAEASAAAVDPAKLPPPVDREVDYARDVRPILEASCLRCHGPERPKSRYRLDQRDAALRGGALGVAVVPANSADSPLIHYVARLVEDLEMPPEGKGEPLTAEQVGILRAWIDQGVAWSTEPSPPSTLFSITPAVQAIAVEGNEYRFREQVWTREGLVGGVNDVRWRQTIDDRSWAAFEAAALGGVEDYRFKLTLQRDDLGFVRAGYEQFRRFFDATGGYYEPFGLPPATLDQELHLDWRKAWIEVGLTLPDWPRLVVGYEYHEKDGDRPTLQWGSVSDPTGVTRAIYPAFKAVDEALHVIRLDASHEVAGVLIEDSFRAEFYDLATERQNVDYIALGASQADVLTRHSEAYRHFQAANALRLEKSLRDWWLLSGGYLYSYLDGDGGFSQETLLPSTPGIDPFLGETVSQILLEQRSHYFNLNTMLGPWRGLHFSAGAQSEWTRQHGFKSGLSAGGAPAIASAHLDKTGFEEDFALRYAGLPYTVLFANARFQQERFDHYEQSEVEDGFGDQRDFLRDSDVGADTQDYRTGFTISPWTPVSLQASYRWRWKDTDYDHLTDRDASLVPGNGYPAFIVAREQVTDEVETKLVWRIRSWWKATLKYQLQRTDYEGATADVTDGGSPDLVYAGGALETGTYEAHVSSLGMVFTPWRRLYLSPTLSFTRSRTLTGAGLYPDIAPYKGEVLSAVASATYVVNDRTDLNASYGFSHGDYGQDAAVAGLPLGIVYDRHGLLVGVTRRFSKQVTGRLQYGFFDYREPTAGHAADYTAHGFYTSLAVAIP